ncbi:MAG: hypothetical protein V8T87_03645 [Victivallales bacterium]
MTATYVLEGIVREALGTRENSAKCSKSLPSLLRTGMESWTAIRARTGVRAMAPADSGDNAIYSETANIMKLVRQEKMNVVFDLHCPWIYPGCNESIYFVGAETETHGRRRSAGCPD